MIRNPVIHIVDDDEGVRDSLTFLLESAGHEVVAFASPLEALQAKDGPACVITDVRMPEMNGLELVEQLRSKDPGLCIIVITGHADIAMAVEAMKKGAMDFLEKPFDDTALLRAVDQALSVKTDGSPAADPEAARRVASLSMRERQVLEGLMNGQSNKEIARDYDLSPRTVEIYRAKVMAKMSAETYADLIRMGLKAGVSPV
ncbi:response regulator FixJ [Brevundimonas sp. 2R-24]|uniref:Response regulator FixJ n=1 Tax=Peiella sedimenti TaxID=3061083 RepID=A0ABT8SJ37_9CAUL|nr:response regulator FixJ [Caulobacteraceae bacterium XZ-24]